MNAASDIISSKKGLASNSTNTFAFFWQFPNNMFITKTPKSCMSWRHAYRGKGVTKNGVTIWEFPKKVGET